MKDRLAHRVRTGVVLTLCLAISSAWSQDGTLLVVKPPLRGGERVFF
ncbi:MAG: hypothetical protein CM1200mP36_11320 [Gammaproteobacteria bacterium]|nr:MAG: hypothetical protein CM1200mP36_11320 [Gammaproteobacteria bacterium]